ncbi:hypothetical protein Tco_1252701 [Tanacetum coccineum]
MCLTMSFVNLEKGNNSFFCLLLVSRGMLGNLKSSQMSSAKLTFSPGWCMLLIHIPDMVVTGSEYPSWLMMRYTKIDINYAAGGNLRRLSAQEAWETIEDCVQCDKQWKNPTSSISDQTIANLKAQLVKNEVVRVMIPKCMSWLDAYDEPISDIEDKVDNPSPYSTL